MYSKKLAFTPGGLPTVVAEAVVSPAAGAEGTFRVSRLVAGTTHSHQPLHFPTLAGLTVIPVFIHARHYFIFFILLTI